MDRKEKRDFCHKYAYLTCTVLHFTLNQMQGNSVQHLLMDL